MTNPSTRTSFASLFPLSVLGLAMGACGDVTPGREGAPCASDGCVSELTCAPGLVCSDGTCERDERATGWRFNAFDPFLGLESELWEATEHTFPGNAAWFSADNRSYNRDGMTLHLTDDGGSAGRGYRGSEVSSHGRVGEFRYGKFNVRMRAARGSGVVSSFVLFREDPWQEIDIEFLGKDTTQIHINVFYNPPSADPASRPLESPKTLDLGFDAADETHEYSVEWLPDRIRWFADGDLLHTTQNDGNIPDLDAHVFMNIWYSEAEDWAGPMDDQALPSDALYGCTSLYEFSP